MLVLRKISILSSRLLCHKSVTPRSYSITKMKIGTHDGQFHCDEALACFMLKLLPQYKDATVIRTRDTIKLEECDIVVDVGAIFDHDKKRYDHHQREFNETLSSLRPELGDSFNIKLSSAGLIYTYYGEEVIKQIASLSSSDLNLIYRKVYENLIKEVDAIDNGVLMTDGETKYDINTHLSKRVGRLNPSWNCKQDIDRDQQFQKAMVMVGEELLSCIDNLVSTWLPARDYVKSALTHRFEVHKSGLIIELKKCVPWIQHFFDLESEMGLGQDIKYVIFEEKPNSWRVYAVPISPTSFVSRKGLHKDWRGTKDNVLSEISGIKGCIFCHNTGFIGGCTTRNGALQMASASLEAE